MARPSLQERRKRLRKLLVVARKKAGLTQADVAKKMGKPQAFVSRYEVGERQIEVAELMDLAHIIGVDVHDIIDELAS